MDKDILPFWQEIGTSTSIIAKRVSEKLRVPTSHTGTLDPMASGVVLILKGDEYFNKEKFIQKNKTYDFDILLGFGTDTHDGLGLVSGVMSEVKLDFENIKQTILNYKGLYHQKYPDFSSKKINGKSLWEYKREGKEIPEVFIDGEISEIEVRDIFEVASNEEINKIMGLLSLIKGNFRQTEILSRYNEIKFPETFIKVKLRVVMSRGLYVRGLARDIAQKLNSEAIVINLVRAKDGEYSKEDCLMLKEYFEEELQNNPKFFEPEYKQI